MALRPCGQLVVSAQASSGAAAQASPLGPLLTVMGRKTLPLLEEKGEIQERIRNGLHGQPSAIADDKQFGHLDLGDAMKSVLKLGTMTPQPPGDEQAKRAHDEKIRDKVMDMLWTSVHIAQQESISDM